MIYLGELTSEQSTKLVQLDDFRSILISIGDLIGSETFKNKSQLSNFVKWDEYFVNILTKETVATRSFRKKIGKSLEALVEPWDIKKQTIRNIQSLPSYKDGYLLPFTIKTRECDPTMPCPSCNGSGNCPDCDGEGFITCDVCDGGGVCPSCEGSGRFPCYSCNQSGVCNCCEGKGKVKCDTCEGRGWYFEDTWCTDCSGTGEYQLRSGRYVKCKSCNGTGNIRERVDCEDCDGTGVATCDNCDGEGYCPKCNGHGDVECRACHGNGRCGKCKGEGRLKCRSCHNTGKCNHCEGEGRVQCSTCKGTGYIQTFEILKLSSETKKVLLSNKKSEILDCENVVRTTLYEGEPYKIEFSKVFQDDQELLSLLSSIENKNYLRKMSEFKAKFIDLDGSSKTQDNRYIEIHVKLEKLNVRKLSVNFSNETFSFYIIGENNSVYCDRKPSLWDRFWARVRS